jgi:TolB-like protein
MRTLSHVTRVLAAAASFALPAVTAAQSPKPIIAVLHFDNSSIGANKGDYDNIGKGIQELLISDLAGNANYRLVDRERIQAVLDEQKLTKDGAIDPTTAVRLGKILGAHYVIYGGFMNAPGGAVLTAHTTDMETSQIQNPIKVTGNPSDVMGLIGQMSSKVGALKLEAKPGRRVGDAGTAPATTPTSAPATGAQQSGGAKPTAEKESSPVRQAEKVETFAKAIAPAAKTTKLDVVAANLYASALDELDNKRPAKAAALFQQVLAKAPGFPPAEEHLKKLGKSGH